MESRAIYYHPLEDQDTHDDFNPPGYLYDSLQYDEEFESDSGAVCTLDNENTDLDAFNAESMYMTGEKQLGSQLATASLTATESHLPTEQPLHEHVKTELEIPVTSSTKRKAASRKKDRKPNGEVDANGVRRSTRNCKTSEKMSKAAGVKTKVIGISERAKRAASAPRSQNSLRHPSALGSVVESPDQTSTSSVYGKIKSQSPNCDSESTISGDGAEHTTVTSECYDEEGDGHLLLRARGAYSAAIFRNPGNFKRKWSRKPVADIFNALELTPETFMDLQGEAKRYMLDSNHPERRNCVGSKGKSDPDFHQIKLYNCAEKFLQDAGRGETYFGAGSEGAETRNFVWPRDRGTINSLVCPLLRKMVTNERQRQYARIARSKNQGSTDIAKTDEGNEEHNEENHERNYEKRGIMEALPTIIGSGIIKAVEAAEQETSQSESTVEANLESTSPPVSSVADCADHEDHSLLPLSAHIFIFQGESLVVPRLTWPISKRCDFEALISVIKAAMPIHQAEVNNKEQDNMLIGALLPGVGMQILDDGKDWTEAISEVENTVWMEGIVKVVVELF